MTFLRIAAPAAAALAFAGSIALTTSQAAGSTVPPTADPAARHAAYSLGADSGYLSRAATVLIDRCMRSHGFAYPVEKPGRRIARDSSYGLSVSEAASSGYQSQSGILTLPDREPEIAPTVPAERTRFYRALFGPDDAPTVEAEDPTAPGMRMGMSSAGCVSAAQRDLFGGDLVAAIRYASVSGNFVDRAATQAAEDSAMRDLNKRWSSCMKEAGRRYADPELAISAARGLAGNSFTGLADGQPREIAIADATCQEQTGYSATRSAIEERHYRLLLNEHRDAIADVRESSHAAAIRAAEVLGDA